MTMKLDHIFIITQAEAPIVDQITKIGLVEGTKNYHPGQGTSNRRFFFSGFKLEFLYISDEHEAKTGAGKELGILARSQDKAASKLGIVSRVVDASSTPDFPSWQYFPDYFDGRLSFYVGNNSRNFFEPLCICMPPSLPAATPPAPEFANDGWNLTSVTISTECSLPSETLGIFSEIDGLSIMNEEKSHLSLEFNNGFSGNSLDLTKEARLSFFW